MTDSTRKTLLLLGASRGLGYALAEEFLKRGWQVVGTVRGASTRLHELASTSGGRLEVETVDIAEPDQVAALRTRLQARVFDMLFVNAGVMNDPRETIADVSTQEFVRVMITNTLSPMRAIEQLHHLVTPAGLIGVMSSGLGSIANNLKGGFEVYRSSKAALNQLMRSYAARHADDQRAIVLMAPGWIRTEMGGLNATFSVEETLPQLVDTLVAQQGRPGLRFIDRFGATVNW